VTAASTSSAPSGHLPLEGKAGRASIARPYGCNDSLVSVGAANGRPPLIRSIPGGTGNPSPTVLEQRVLRRRGRGVAITAGGGAGREVATQKFVFGQMHPGGAGFICCIKNSCCEGPSAADHRFRRLPVRRLPAGPHPDNAFGTPAGRGLSPGLLPLHKEK